ncbi:MAG TPA: hypothetical protein VF881_16145 [Polyangiaceae bacterium]
MSERRRFTGPIVAAITVVSAVVRDYLEPTWKTPPADASGH